MNAYLSQLLRDGCVMKKKTVAIIQARMGSTRFPGKSMKFIGKWSVVELVLKRVKQSTRVDQVILATTENSDDDVLAQYVSQMGFPVFRGSEEDVLSRFYQAAAPYQPDIVVRITGDCPLISPTLIDQSVNTFEETRVDYLTLLIGEDKTNAFPRGLDVEVAKFSAISKAKKNATEKYEREHVMPFLYTHPELFSVYYIKPEPAYSRPEYRLCVDSPLDYELMLKISDNFGEQLIETDIEEIIKFLDKNPELVKINQTVRQKHFTETG